MELERDHFKELFSQQDDSQLEHPGADDRPPRTVYG